MLQKIIIFLSHFFKVFKVRAYFFLKSFISSSKFKWWLLFSFFNVVLCYYLFDVYIFIIRQFIVSAIFLFFFKFEENIKILAAEDRFIESRVNGEYPIFKYYGYCLFIFIITWWIVTTLGVGVIGEEIMLSCYLYWIFFAFFTFCKAMATIGLKETLRFYDIAYSIKTTGFRSFSTASKMYHGGKFLGRIVFGMVALDIGGEKVIVGDVGYRSLAERGIGYRIYGVDAKWAYEMRDAVWLKDHYPEAVTDHKLNYFDKNGFMTAEGKKFVKTLPGYEDFQSSNNLYNGKLDHKHGIKFPGWFSKR